MQQNLLRMKAAIAEWLTKEGWLGDAGFYTVEQWRARGEPWLTDSLLILVFDGSTLHTMLNFGGDHDEFDELVQSFGFCYELGSHWNMGFYPIDDYDYSPLTGGYATKLRDPRWKAKAARVKQRAEQRCQDCGGSTALEAHHCYYAAIREDYQPWEYPLSAFRALCRACHVSRAKIEVRMRAYMATLSQSHMERLREGLGRAFAFFDENSVLTFLEKIGPRDDHLGTAVAALSQGIRDDYL